MEQKQTRRIEIVSKVDGSPELKRMAAEFGNLNKKVADMSGTMGTLKGVMLTFFGALGASSIGSIASMSDQIQLSVNRIAAMTGSMEEARSVMADLAGVAQDTRRPLSDLLTIYSRMKVTTKDLGVSQRDLVDFTKVLTNTFRLSGSSTAEATAASIQMSQGFASGQLRGQELRSVLEANAVAGEILAKAFDTTRGGLYKLAEQGKLTTDKVFPAFLKASQEINEQANQMAATFGETMTVAMDKFAQQVEMTATSLDLQGKFSKGMGFIANNFEILLKVLAGGAIAAGLAKVAAGIGAVVASAGAAGGIAGIVAAIAAFPATIAAAVVALGVFLSVKFDGFYDFIARVTKFLSGPLALFPSLLFAVAKEFLKLIGVIDGSASLENLNKTFLDTFKIISDTLALDTMAERLDRIDSKVKGVTLSFDAFGKATRSSPLADGTNVSKDLTAPTKFKSSIPEIKKEAKEFEALNREYFSTNMTLSEYIDKARKASNAFNYKKVQEGTMSITAYNEALRQSDVGAINKQFAEGAISLETYNAAIRNNSIGELNAKVLEGKINMSQYREEMLATATVLDTGGALYVASEKYLKETGNLSQQVSNAFGTMFKGLEDAFVEFFQTGTQDWKAFGKMIEAEIQRIAVRSLILQPLTAGIQGLIGAGQSPNLSGAGVGGNSGSYSTGANLNFGYGPGQKSSFATASAIPMSNKIGGSATTVNIINNSGVEISQSESQGSGGERTLDILIESKVKQGFSNGAFDKTMKNSYGLSRKGY